jgi:hypothetical protein
MSIYDRFGVRTIINAKGPSTRLSGGFLDADVSAAMAEAGTYCVEMAELQAGASKVIAGLTGAEAGIVTSGAAAGLLLGTAACVTGLDPVKMGRLPGTRGMKNEVVMVRSQRNFYDHAVRTCGVHLVEVGLPTATPAPACATPRLGRSKPRFPRRPRPCFTSREATRSRRFRKSLAWRTRPASRLWWTPRPSFLRPATCAGF